MRPKAEEPRSGCAIKAAVEVIGDRWSLLVLRDIMFGNRRHFRVLQKQSEERIASNILADRSRRLVEDGLLTREDAGRGRRSTDLDQLRMSALPRPTPQHSLPTQTTDLASMNRCRIDGRRAVPAAPQEER